MHASRSTMRAAITLTAKLESAKCRHGRLPLLLSLLWLSAVLLARSTHN